MLNLIVMYSPSGRYDAALVSLDRLTGTPDRIVEAATAESLRSLAASFLNTADELDKLNKVEVPTDPVDTIAGVGE